MGGGGESYPITMPDLIIESIEATPTLCTGPPGGPMVCDVLVTATVKNIGDEGISLVQHTMISVQRWPAGGGCGPLVINLETLPMGPGQSVEVETTFAGLEENAYNAFAEADAFRLIRERDETNNVGTIEFEVP